MNLLMISGDRSLASGRQGAFWQTLEELRKHWERIDILCPPAQEVSGEPCKMPFETAQRVMLRRSTADQCDVSKHRLAGPPHGDTIFPNVFLHPSPYNLWYQPLWILRKGKELLRQHQYTVITVHDYPPFYNGLGAWMLHRATGVPWVSEMHHVVGYPHSANMQERIGRMLYGPYLKTIAKSTAAFRVVNTGMKELLVRFGARGERIFLVPSFYLDHGLLQPDPTIEKKYDVVFCGRLSPNKGVCELLKALDIIACDTKVTAYIIGDGPQLPIVAKHKNVSFDRWYDTPQEVYRAMQSAKIFIMCSKSEGGPRVALEAMALGLPIIATNVGVIPDVIRDGENGLITTGTSEDLAQKIQKLLFDDALRTRLGQRARDVLQKFERKRLIQEYAHFLQSFI